MGLGCGTPLAFTNLREGETVLDLGSGGGLDCFLAAKQVGAAGRIIGVDMTPEMLAKARRAVERLAADNVEFRLGEIERLPLPDRSVDVILSNCVINLSPDSWPCSCGRDAGYGPVGCVSARKFGEQIAARKSRGPARRGPAA